MKRRKFIIYTNILHMTIKIVVLLYTLSCMHVNAGIVPPPWSDPEKNPCVRMPGGWQLLYWPPLQQCFKIFTIGYPCPETMELSPTATNGKIKGSANKIPAAECRCPPGTALNIDNNKCFNIFERGPCESGQYFAPMPDSSTIRVQRMSNRMGQCRSFRQCPSGMAYWPKDNKCYITYAKGPCAKGKLLIANEDALGECRCENAGILGEFFYATEQTCHEHYTKGPCPTRGHLFLPGGRCDCHRHLPHYDEDQQMCFELNSPGPCLPGHIFHLPKRSIISENDSILRAQCQCKDGYIPWKDGHCYRLYTRGPCAPNEFLINATTCVHNFCGKGQLYFPDQKSCYRLGSQGPCELNQVVVFDFTSRPSIDGISHNGVCGCAGLITNLDQQCTVVNSDFALEPMTSSTCETIPGMVELDGHCYKLYTRGPCDSGQWLEPQKMQIGEILSLHNSKAKCVCQPGYTLELIDSKDTDTISYRCNAPSVELARSIVM